MNSRNTLNRRSFLKYTGSAGAFASFPALAANTTQEKFLGFYHLHTGERLNIPYWAEGSYLPDTLAHINYLLRDFRAKETITMDTTLLDALHKLHTTLGSKKDFHVISGYRSPATNAKLMRQGRSVAKKSFHMKGQAIDVYLPDVSLKRLHRAAIDLNIGGIGYYRKSGFIHIDTGPVRRWG
ncbi:MAG: DUF882 domain-containing protein [Pseudomonadales bacterium]